LNHIAKMTPVITEDEQQAEAARRAFAKKDLDGSNTISVDELQGLADYMGLPIANEDLDETLAVVSKILF
jgi:Ca2+-binding EF-hand superfamily protein